MPYCGSFLGQRLEGLFDLDLTLGTPLNKSKPMSLRVNAKGLAEACGVSSGWVSRLKKRGIITPNEHGTYDLEEDSKRIGRPVDLGGLSMETPEEGDEVKVIDFGKWRAFKMKLEDHQWVRLKTVNREKMILVNPALTHKPP